jgi:DNA polymerase II small subunit/DNA polymerase delta subunit B
MLKMIEAMQGGDKPNILAVGHYHKIEYISYRNVHAFQTGTFQAQTPWMRGKGIAAMMGGWIVEVDVDGDGSIRSIKQELIPYYKAIKDDYKNFSAR